MYPGRRCQRSIEITQNGVKSPATLTITGGQNSSMAFVSQLYTLNASVSLIRCHETIKRAITAYY